MRTTLSGLLCLTLLVFCISAKAQITITAADLPSTGNTYRISLADTLLALDPEPTGEDFTWDFSFLDPITQFEENWVSPLETDILYFLLFGISNMAQSVALPAIPGLELTDAFNFYEKNSSAFAQTGLAGKLAGLPVVIPFDDEDRVVEFPLEYGNTERDESEFSVVVPSIAELREERVRESIADGWGTLITPYGTFDVLRLKSVIEIRDTLSGSLGNFLVERLTIEYRWLGAGQGLPLLQIDLQETSGLSFITRIAYLDSLREEPIGFTEPSISEWSLLPNPALSTVLLRGSIKKQISLEPILIDGTGRVAKQWPVIDAQSGHLECQLDLSGCPPGMYWLLLQSASSKEPIHSVLPLQVR